MLSIEVDLTQFHERVKASAKAINDDMERAVKRAAEMGRDKAKAGGFKDQTGNLRSGITAQVLGWSGSTYRWDFRTTSTYARFVEEPTREHWIYPKAGYNAKTGTLEPGQTRRARGKGPHEHIVGRGQFLRWKGGDGQSHFARQVFHPGTMGFWFMRSAEANSPRFLREAFRDGFVSLQAVWN